MVTLEPCSRKFSALKFPWILPAACARANALPASAARANASSGRRPPYCKRLLRVIREMAYSAMLTEPSRTRGRGVSDYSPLPEINLIVCDPWAGFHRTIYSRLLNPLNFYPAMRARSRLRQAHHSLSVLSASVIGESFQIYVARSRGTTQPGPPESKPQYTSILGS